MAGTSPCEHDWSDWRDDGRAPHLTRRCRSCGEKQGTSPRAAVNVANKFNPDNPRRTK